MEEYYKLELVATTFDVSVYAVFWATFKAGGYVTADDYVEQHFARYLHTQEVPVHVLRYCSKVLDGKEPFLFDNGTACLLC